VAPKHPLQQTAAAIWISRRSTVQRAAAAAELRRYKVFHRWQRLVNGNWVEFEGPAGGYGLQLA
jgi:hypothetical protein